MSALLAIDGLSVAYHRKGLTLDGVGLTIAPGQIVALLGANGAGKTTLIRAVSGVIGLHGGSITAGRVTFDGRDVTRMGADRIVRLGMGQVPEGRLIFKTLTVEENLNVGAAILPGSRRTARLASIYELFPRLAERRRQPAGLMSGGEQQMLAVGRALASEPRLILIDELSLGLAPLIVKAIYDQLRTIVATTGTAILIVEQNARIALQYCDEAHLLERGRIVLSGPAAALAADPKIRDAYLGEAPARAEATA